MSQQSARDFFESARDAAREAERIARQLESMEESSEGVGGGGFEPRVRSTPDPGRMAARVARSVDVGEVLRAREAECYRIIDAACALLYGRDNRSGLYALVGWPADAIYHHYLALRTWPEAAALLGYSQRYVMVQVAAAFDVADANGFMWTERGRGMAE